MEFATIPVTLDTALDSIPPIRLNGGDIAGYRLEVTFHDHGQALVVPANINKCAVNLIWNPDRSRADSAGGLTAMTVDATGDADGDTTTIKTASAPIPRDLLARAGEQPLLGVEIVTRGEDGATESVIVSRNIPVIIEPAVLRADTPAITDPLQELHDAQKLAQDAVDRANQVIEGASIDIGTTTTLAPKQAATAELAGTGLKRTLNLGIPRGAKIQTMNIHMLSPDAQPSVFMGLSEDEDYRIQLNIPRGEKGDKGDTGEQGVPGNAGTVATADVAGVIKISERTTPFRLADDTLEILTGPGIKVESAGETNRKLSVDLAAGTGITITPPNAPGGTVTISAASNFVWVDSVSLGSGIQTMLTQACAPTPEDFFTQNFAVIALSQGTPSLATVAITVHARDFPALKNYVAAHVGSTITTMSGTVITTGKRLPDKGYAQCTLTWEWEADYVVVKLTGMDFGGAKLADGQTFALNWPWPAKAATE